MSSVSTLGMALYNGWKMTLVVLAGLPVIALANRIQQNEADATVEPEGIEALMKTSFKKMETISSLGLENKFTKQYKDAIFEKYKHALKKALASGFAFALGQAMVFFIYAGALRFGCYLISINDMTPIQVLGVLMTVLFGSSATSSTRAPTRASEDNDDSLNRLFNDTVTDVEDLAGDKMEEVKGNLNFEHVELPHPLHKGPPLMSQLNIKVSGGQTLAIVPLDEGTLNPFELLVERFYDPAKGGLFLDGTNLQSLDLSWLRSQIAVVSHRCFMPHYSIADNIAYGNDNRAWALTRREIEDAAYSAHAHEFILELSKGYDTVCEEDEVVISESQKLRIVIARAIIRGSPIVVLEELLQEEEAVNEATSIICRNKTCLIFTRRQQTVEAADQIVLLYRGRILEQGTPQELRGLGRLYHLLTYLETGD
ncbi:ATP-dependent translocase ABCB1-like [Acropora palmata]|uniref:ATP-dependent translocase ABCB1-like n=1 Tax=Acropora palmata TaxID=6131 RepID=UPI003DA06254